MLSRYLNPLLACKHQNAAVPQQEVGGWLGRSKLGKPSRVSGVRSPHGSINNDGHRLKFRSKEMLLGSTRHPQCWRKPRQQELGGLQLLLRLVSSRTGTSRENRKKNKNKKNHTAKLENPGELLALPLAAPSLLCRMQLPIVPLGFSLQSPVKEESTSPGSFPFLLTPKGYAGTCCRLVGSGTMSNASPISHRPPVGQAARGIFFEWISHYWNRLCREEREAEHGKEQPRLLMSFFLLAPAWTAIHRAGTARAAADSPQKPLLSLQQWLQRQTSHLYLESLSKCKSAALQLQTSCSIQC